MLRHKQSVIYHEKQQMLFVLCRTLSCIYSRSIVAIELVFNFVSLWASLLVGLTPWWSTISMSMCLCMILKDLIIGYADMTQILNREKVFWDSELLIVEDYTNWAHWKTGHLTTWHLHRPSNESAVEILCRTFFWFDVATFDGFVTTIE